MALAAEYPIAARCPTDASNVCDVLIPYEFE